MPILFLLFAVIPIAEIALLIHVGGEIGGLNTLALVILTAAVGAYLVKREGIATLTAAQTKMQQQQMPGMELVEGACLLVAGVLLVTPGFMTDIFGFLLVVPFTRKAIAKSASKHLSARVVTSGNFTHRHYDYRKDGTSGQGDVFEGEFHKHNDQQIGKDEHDK